MRQVAAKLETVSDALQHSLQQVQTLLAETQHSAIAQQPRADTLEAQLKQLREALKSKPHRTAPDMPRGPRVCLHRTLHSPGCRKVAQ